LTVRIEDPEVVRREYASEAGLEGRRAAYRYAEGPNAAELAFEAIAEARPRRMLEVGCGPGELAERVKRELEAEVVAVDISPRMVELARARGVDARLGDVQELSFGDGEFDCAVAAWMLYHVSDIDRAISELARVLRPGGRLVAVTNHPDHLRELRELIGLPAVIEWVFNGANGAELLRRHFDSVETRDAAGTVHFPGREEVAAYVAASMTLAAAPHEVPELDGPFVVRIHPVIFVAERA
jgi:SAM-dependent methyltransferase